MCDVARATSGGPRDPIRGLRVVAVIASLETVEARALGNLTLTTLRTRGHGADSDTPFVDTVWVVVNWRDRKVVRWRVLTTEAEALEAVGLSE